ncbi:MAG: acyltransferase family protein [Kangiellaceae bacterium]|nr:acyltransferase family protein [Kangiellaceae bacterium]
MDNLRALAMLLGIFFHAALAYSPMMGQLWMTADTQTSSAIDIVAWFTHLFRMPLFFFIAGFFTLMLLKKYSVGGMLKNRSKRILLPFFIFLPLVLISLIIGIGWALGNVENQSPFLKLIAMMQNNPDAPQPPFSTTHLWFLYNLCWFYLAAAVIYKSKIHLTAWLNKIMNPSFILLVLPALMIPALLTQTAPHPAPERIYPELWSFGFYGLFFLFGYLAYQKKELLKEIERFGPLLFVISLVGYAYLYYQMPKVISLADMMKIAVEGISFSVEHLIVAALECYVAVYMTLVCLIYGKSLLNAESKLFRYVADSSYWVYIIHLPLLFIIQYWLLDIEMNLWIKFIISSFGTLGIGIISYTLIVRSTPIGSLLNGKRYKFLK